MRFFAALLVIATLFLGGQQAHAQLPGMEIHVAAGLEAETLRPASGSTVTLAITMRPDPGWHGYWSNPGDAGEGLSLDWKLPAGASAGTPHFPVPETLIISGFMNYVYERPHAVLVDLKLPDGLAAGTVLPISVHAYWLACTDRVCVPQEGRLSLDLRIGDGAIDPANRARFDAWRAELPVPLDREARYAVTGKRIEIAIPYPASAALAQPYYFPAAAGVIDHMAPQKLRRTGNWLVVETALSPTRKKALPDTISGLFRIGEGEGLMVSARAGAVPKGGEPVAGASPAAASKIETPFIGWLLLGALVGGLLLNIMPCVFPILGLKALALAKAGGDEGEARADALAYTLGVVVSCITLGAIMLLLRAGGQEVGWAFQLQEPGFVLFLFLLMVAITANLLGLFELGNVQLGDALTRKQGLIGSFWTGALAAIVATPCTGPFMAAALGTALLLPTAQALLLFATLGIGIALPFLAIAYIPALRGRLPRPGPWLATFRKAMAIPMGLTALALLWLLGRLDGPQMVVVATILALVLLLFFIVAHYWKKRGLAMAAVGFGLVLFSGWMLLPHIASPIRATPNATALPSERFSEARLAALRAQGQPAFVYFTADWCVTCKINEAAVLEREETAKLFASRGISVLRGDFTKRDAAIARFLSVHGAAGVPLYLYYPKGNEPQKLPQILTQAILSDAIKN
jgi:DsbC/DsbD-like thiol-disulfide interchange protein/cytochrome c biogenesis protein CcdA